MHYYLICTGYNCANLAKRCYESINNIDFDKSKYTAVFASDGSTDNTAQLLQEIIPLPHKVWIQSENKGAAYTRHHIIKNLCMNDEDVIILVGLDDEVLPNILTEVDKHYKTGKWMTYGNWIDQYGRGLPSNFKLDFERSTHASRNYRRVTYRSTAPNTFKYFLYKQIPKEDLQINGEWINTTTESEVMFSCLEMCGKDKIGIITKPIYLYNRNLPNGTLKRLGREYKYQILEIIKNRPKRNQLFL